MGLDDKVTNALMGHIEYLDEAYLRLEQKGEIAKAYLEDIPNVSVYAVEDQQLRQQASAIEQENIELKTRLSRVELEITELKKKLEKLLS